MADQLIRFVTEQSLITSVLIAPRFDIAVSRLLTGYPRL